MVTNNIRDLAPGRGVYAFLLNPQGHILADLTAYQRGESILVESDASQLEKTLSTFDHYIIMDDVELTNITHQAATVGAVGPNCQAVLNAAGFEIPPLEPLQIADQSWQGNAVTLVRGEHGQYPAYELWIAPDRVPSLVAALQTAGASPVGTEALELYRIVLGVPRYGQDIRERDLPQETEQLRALNFNKGCYVGQEIVERIRSRGNVHRKFTGFKVAGPPLAPGAKIQSQAKDIGEITSAAVIPAAGNLQVALGYIRREVAMPGKEIQVDGVRAMIADLPFTDLLTP
jgi:folate-binding protein YgfZ